jgi:hypothetical protein
MEVSHAPDDFCNRSRVALIAAGTTIRWSHPRTIQVAETAGMPVSEEFGATAGVSKLPNDQLRIDHWKILAIDKLEVRHGNCASRYAFYRAKASFRRRLRLDRRLSVISSNAR